MVPTPAGLLIRCSGPDGAQHSSWSTRSPWSIPQGTTISAGYGQTALSPAGAPHRQTAPSPWSIPERTTPAVYERTAPSPAGAITGLDRPHRRTAPSPWSIPERATPACGRTGWTTALEDTECPVATPAGYGRMAPSPAGAITGLGKPHRQTALSPWSMPGSTTPAGYERTAPSPAGAGTCKDRPHRRTAPLPWSILERTIPAGYGWTAPLPAGVASPEGVAAELIQGALLRKRGGVVLPSTVPILLMLARARLRQPNFQLAAGDVHCRSLAVFKREPGRAKNAGGGSKLDLAVHVQAVRDNPRGKYDSEFQAFLASPEGTVYADQDLSWLRDLPSAPVRPVLKVFGFRLPAFPQGACRGQGGGRVPAAAQGRRQAEVFPAAEEPAGTQGRRLHHPGQGKDGRQPAAHPSDGVGSGWSRDTMVSTWAAPPRPCGC